MWGGVSCSEGVHLSAWGLCCGHEESYCYIQKSGKNSQMQVCLLTTVCTTQSQPHT
jgi:hypothetical protein